MEERILDEDERRGILLKKTADGQTDAVEDTGEEEVAFDFPEEYDETLAGLSQAQAEEELARREKAHIEAQENCRKLLEEGKALLAEGKFREAEDAFAQASVYDSENTEAADGLFAAATKNFTDTERLYSDERREDLMRTEEGRKLVLEKLGDRLREERKLLGSEADSLRPQVEEKRSERREAFAANKKHYIIRTCIALALTVAFAIAAAISADNILRVQNSTVPVALTAVFGVLTFLSVTMLAVYCAKLIGANRLCRENEKADSTKDGARLVLLEDRLAFLDALLGETPTEESPFGEDPSEE